MPTNIKILGLEWKVINEKHAADAAEAFGTTVHASQTINIDPSCSELHSRQVLLHEILHAIWWQMGLSRLPEHTTKLEEQIVNAMANGLYSTLSSNPELRTYLS